MLTQNRDFPSYLYVLVPLTLSKSKHGINSPMYRINGDNQNLFVPY